MAEFDGKRPKPSASVSLSAYRDQHFKVILVT